jgi:glycosyltransferase involved in cell wall biosynthesis
MVKKDTFDILYAGNLSPEKGIRLLLAALRDIKEDFVRLHIAGGGIEQKQVEKSAALDQRIIYYGRQAPSVIKQLLSKCDFLVIPSIWFENFPTVVIEAFSFGLPVIGSAIGGIKEQISEGGNGYLFPPGDIGALKEKILLLVRDFKDNGEILRGLKTGACESGKKYAKKQVIPEFISLYEKLKSQKIDGKR